MFVSFNKAQFVRGELSSKSKESHEGYTQRGGAYAIEVSRVSILLKVPVTGGTHRWRSGHQSQVRWLQGRQASSGVEVCQGFEHDPWNRTVKLKYWVARVLSSYSSQVSEVPLILVSRWSCYPSVQTCDLGHSSALLRAFP